MLVIILVCYCLTMLSYISNILLTSYNRYMVENKKYERMLTFCERLNLLISKRIQIVKKAINFVYI